MARPIDRFPIGPIRDTARRVDTLGDGDGAVSDEEVAAVAQKQLRGEPVDGVDRYVFTNVRRWVERPRGAPAPSIQADPLLSSRDVSRLNETQKAVVYQVEANARALSAAGHQPLLAKAAALGISEPELQAAMAWLRTRAPLTINFDAATAPAMVKGDGRYQNQFETGTSGAALDVEEGGFRDELERQMFAGAYHLGPLQGTERPKYGSINVAGRPDGGAPDYGDCHFELKSSLRDRCTFSASDSAGSSWYSVGNFESFEHVLKNVSPEILRCLVDQAAGRPVSELPPAMANVELQIHGPVELGQDVARIVAPIRHRGTPAGAALEALASKHGLPLVWRDETA